MVARLSANQSLEFKSQLWLQKLQERFVNVPHTYSPSVNVPHTYSPSDQTGTHLQMTAISFRRKTQTNMLHCELKFTRVSWLYMKKDNHLDEGVKVLFWNIITCSYWNRAGKKWDAGGSGGYCCFSFSQIDNFYWNIAEKTLELEGGGAMEITHGRGRILKR